MENFLSTEQGPRAQAEYSGSSKMRRHRTEFRIAKVPGFYKAGHWRGGTYEEVGIQSLCGSSQ